MSEPSKIVVLTESELEAVIERAVLKALSVGHNGNGNDSPALLSAEAAAKLWDVPKTWIAEAARRGELPSVKVGHYVRFRIADLQAFIASNAQGK